MKTTRFLLAAVFTALVFAFVGCSFGGDGFGGGGSGGYNKGTPSASQLSRYGITQTQFTEIVNVIGTSNYTGWYEIHTVSFIIQWENKTTTDYNNMKEHLETLFGGTFYEYSNGGEVTSILGYGNEKSVGVVFDGKRLTVQFNNY
jgi:hypothetical protein